MCGYTQLFEESRYRFLPVVVAAVLCIYTLLLRDIYIRTLFYYSALLADGGAGKLVCQLLRERQAVLLGISVVCSS